MFIICFEKNILAGGLGDRINGLISTYLISNLLNKPFYILWNKEDVKKYIDYEKYDFEKQKYNISQEELGVYYMIDKQKQFKDLLISETDDKLFPHQYNKFYSNQECSQYLFKNKAFLNKNYYEMIFAAYKKLYTDFLKPTPFLFNKINDIVQNNENMIGIQIRTGDCYMMSTDGIAGGYVRVKNPEKEIRELLENVKKDLTENNQGDAKIFLTSDYFNIYKIGCEIFNKTQIVYVNDIIQHLDRDSVTNDLSKIFMDSYILSQKTSKLYITSYSNFGRIAALAASHDETYDIQSLEKVNLKKFVSNGERLFE